MTTEKSKNTADVTSIESSFDMEFYIDAFEQQLATDPTTSVEEFTPSQHHPKYHEIVTELLRIDLERRRETDVTARAHDYLIRFGETLSDKHQLAQLVFEEYRLCCLAGESVTTHQFADDYGIDVDSWPQPHEVLEPPSETNCGRQEAYLRAGEQIFDFQVITEFGRGAFSRVYLAQQGNLANRLVVLKVSRRFWNESNLLAKLQHTNIMPIHSVHRKDGLQIVCMPFWGTCTLSDVLANIRKTTSHERMAVFQSTIANHQDDTVASVLRHRETQSERAASPDARLNENKTAADPPTFESHVTTCLTIAKQTAEALQHAHQREIVHGDLKPANILLTPDERPLVLDFNLAGYANTTPTDGIGGTLPYMAPEQIQKVWKGEGQREYSSDVFSLGVILFELLTAQRPYPDREGHLADIAATMVDDRRMTPSVRTVDPQIPPGADSIVQRCLAYDLNERYATAQQLCDDLDAHLHHRPLIHAAEDWHQQIIKTHRRHPRLLPYATLLVTVTLTFVAIFGFARKARENAGLQAVANLRRFYDDADEIDSLLSTTGIDDNQIDHAIDQASTWIAHYAQPQQFVLSNRQIHKAKNRLGRLAIAVAHAHRTRASRFPKGSMPHRSHVRNYTEWLQTASKQFESSPLVLEIHQTSLVGEIDPTQRSRQLLEELTDYPDSSFERMLLAREHYAVGQFTKAKDLLLEYIRHVNRDYSAWALLGNIYRAQLSFSDSERCWSMCIGLRPDIGFGYFQRGLVRLETHDFVGAEDDFSSYLAQHSENAAARVNLALAFKGQQRWGSALRNVDAAIERGATMPRIYLLRSDLCHALSDKQGAAEDLAKGLAAQPNDETNCLARGMAFLKKGDSANALADFQAALRHNPFSVNAMKNCAHVLSEYETELDQAAGLLTRAIKVRAKDAELWGSRAVLLARSGKRGKAISDIQAALSLRQDEATFLRAGSVYALTHRNQADLDKAMMFVRQAVVLNPRWAPAVASDPDLESLRDQKRFQETIQSANTLLKYTPTKNGS